MAGNDFAPVLRNVSLNAHLAGAPVTPLNSPAGIDVSAVVSVNVASNIYGCSVPVMVENSPAGIDVIFVAQNVPPNIPGAVPVMLWNNPAGIDVIFVP